MVAHAGPFDIRANDASDDISCDVDADYEYDTDRNEKWQMNGK